MFAVLAILLVFAFGNFGAVLAHAWLALELFWLVSVLILIVGRFLKGRPLSPYFIAFVIGSMLIAAVAQPKLSVGLMAIGWSYVAACDSESNILRFFRFLVVLGVLEAFLGLVQYFLLPGWILGYQSPYNETSGTLINRNHFAGLLEMLIPVAFGLAYTASRRFDDIARPYLYLLAGAIMGLALVFSMSRMGILSFMATVFFLAMVLRLRESQRRIGTVLVLGLVGLVLGGAAWIGIDGIVQRYMDLGGTEGMLKEGRVLIYSDVLRMIGNNPDGVGTGRFQDRFRPYQNYHPDFLIDHAHNDYLETAAEWGLPIAAAFWSCLIFAVFRCVRQFVSSDSAEERGVLIGCLGAIFTILIHSLTDFNLQIPSNAMLFFTFVGISLAIPIRSLKSV